MIVRVGPRPAGAAAVMLGLLASAAGGCGRADGRVPVSGTVTYKGQPLDQGRIEFEPAGGEAFFTGGVIDNGRFQVAAKSGLRPGTYRVRVYSSAPPGGPPKDPLNPAPHEMPKERVAAKYNVTTELTAEVTAAGPNEFAFAVSP